MFSAKIAEIKINVNSHHSGLLYRCKDFLCDGGNIDCIIDPYSDNSKFLDIAEENFVAFRMFADRLYKYDAYLLHSAFIKMNDRGIAFAAQSGVGKTTHILLWKRLFGNDMLIINGDKPVVRFIDDSFYAFGTPWNGKEKMGCNAKAKFTDLCFIERSETNSITRITQSESLERIINQVYMPKDALALKTTLDLINKTLNLTSQWLIKCNTDITAAQIAYDGIFKE